MRQGTNAARYSLSGHAEKVRTAPGRDATPMTGASRSRRAGVSVSAPYKHFADQDAPLASLALRGYEDQRRRYRAALDSAADPVEQLAAFAVAYVRFAAEERALFDITFLAALHDDLLRVTAAAHGLALFLQQDMLPGRWHTGAAVEAQAADAARTPARQERPMPVQTTDFTLAAERIGRGKYVSLTTYRRNGRGSRHRWAASSMTG